MEERKLNLIITALYSKNDIESLIVEDLQRNGYNDVSEIAFKLNYGEGVKQLIDPFIESASVQVCKRER